MLVVLDAPSALFADVASRLSIVCGSLAGNEELKTLFGTQLIGEDSLDDTIRWSQGWIKERIDIQISQNRPCYIAKKDFHEALVTYVRHHDRIAILKSFAGTPDPSEVELELALRKYVRQLKCISLDDDSVLSAVNDYLRAVVDRTHWSEEGYVNTDALDALAEELVTTWRNKERRVTITHSALQEEHRGQLLFTDCIEHSTNLDGLCTPPHFIRGSWHALADDLAIGWHPRFKQLLSVGNGASPDTTDSQGGEE
ncbi:MAG: ABC-three component system protein [Planctomycetaceae bacterium]